MGAIRRQIGVLAVAGYQQSAMTTTAQLLLSSDPEQFLRQASTAQAFAGQQNAVLRKLQAAEGRLADLEVSQRTEFNALNAVQAKQDAFKAQIESNLAEAQRVLSKLTGAERARLAAEEAAEERRARAEAAAERRRRASRDLDRGQVGVAASGRAKAAVDYALAQIGDPYVWGGRPGLDCSGLTMAAWATAGVSLSHSSKAQYGEGRQVTRGELQPGDLIFYYSPISHVAMYIGDGKIVHASRPGKPVKIDPALGQMPYTGAVRPG